MSQSNCSNELVLLAATLAITLSKGLSADDVNVLGNFIIAVGSNITVIAATKAQE